MDFFMGVVPGCAGLSGGTAEGRLPAVFENPGAGAEQRVGRSGVTRSARRSAFPLWPAWPRRVLVLSGKAAFVRGFEDGLEVARTNYIVFLASAFFAGLA